MSDTRLETHGIAPQLPSWGRSLRYGKSKVASLFDSPPISCCASFQTLTWTCRGGGPELYHEALQKLGLNIVGSCANGRLSGRAINRISRPRYAVFCHDDATSGGLR